VAKMLLLLRLYSGHEKQKAAFCSWIFAELQGAHRKGMCLCLN
jgi:hypothetical protein